MTTISKLKRQLKTAETPLQAAAVHGQLALLYAQQEVWQKAGQHFQQGGNTAEAVLETIPGALAVAAQMRHAQGMMWQLLPKRQLAAVRALHRAEALYKQANMLTEAAEVHALLAEMMIDLGGDEAQGLSTAVAELNQALEILPEGSPVRQKIELYQQRASVQLFRQNRAAFEADMQTAIDLAQAHHLPNLALKLEMNRAQAGQWLADTPEEQEPITAVQWAEWRQKATRQNDPAALLNIALEEVPGLMRQGNFAAAEAQAEEARQLALASSAPTRFFDYMTACLLLSEAQAAHDNLDKDTAVVETLLTCKTTLQRYDLPDLAELIKARLDALLPLWGAERFQAALSAYRATMNKEQ